MDDRDSEVIGGQQLHGEIRHNRAHGRRVQLARKRMANGFYLSDAIARATARIMLASPGKPTSPIPPSS